MLLTTVQVDVVLRSCFMSLYSYLGQPQNAPTFPIKTTILLNIIFNCVCCVTIKMYDDNDIDQIFIFILYFALYFALF